MRETILVALLGVCASACAGSPKRASLLIDDVRGYNDGIRWQNQAQAAVRIPPAEREPFFDEREEVEEDLRISDYELTRMHTSSRGQRALVHVKWTWHLDSRGVVHTTTTAQKWRLYGKRWLMIDEKRLRGEPMPGMAEPPEPAPRRSPTAGRTGLDPGQRQQE
jgi:hypothetical protein